LLRVCKVRWTIVGVPSLQQLRPQNTIIFYFYITIDHP
jgi:hypothetical protein